MVFLNGKFILQEEAKISTLDRGFLFGDGVYEVIPVYNKKIFQLELHLQRLARSLESTKIKNPYNFQEYQVILEKLIAENNNKNQSIYLQISRGTGTKREYKFDNSSLIPTVYICTDKLEIQTKNKLLNTKFEAIIRDDIRWGNCQIKSTSLLAGVLYSLEAQENNAEEVILIKDNFITEGASSNIFILKNNKVYTPKMTNNILSGITRDMVIQSCKLSNIPLITTDITKADLMSATEIWISSSTREIMPITKIEKQNFSCGSEIWQKVYTNFQNLK